MYILRILYALCDGLNSCCQLSGLVFDYVRLRIENTNGLNNAMSQYDRKDRATCFLYYVLIVWYTKTDARLRKTSFSKFSYRICRYITYLVEYYRTQYKIRTQAGKAIRGTLQEILDTNSPRYFDWYYYLPPQTRQVVHLTISILVHSDTLESGEGGLSVAVSYIYGGMSW